MRDGNKHQAKTLKHWLVSGYHSFHVWEAREIDKGPASFVVEGMLNARSASLPCVIQPAVDVTDVAQGRRLLKSNYWSFILRLSAHLRLHDLLHNRALKEIPISPSHEWGGGKSCVLKCSIRVTKYEIKKYYHRV